MDQTVSAHLPSFKGHGHTGEGFATVVGIPDRHLEVVGVAWLRDAPKRHKYSTKKKVRHPYITVSASTPRTYQKVVEAIKCIGQASSDKCGYHLSGI